MWKRKFNTFYLAIEVENGKISGKKPPCVVEQNTAYFCAQWRRQKITELQKDYVILDGVEGRGHYVGTYLALITLERYWWGEGEVKF